MDELLTKEEILGGLPAGRARTLLLLIESKTAHSMAHAQQAMDVHLTEEGERRRDLAFLEAFALGREPPLRPKIQDLERFVPLWAHLVPDNVHLRAAIAHALGAKYRVSYRSTPQIQRALGLGMEAVQSAYHSQYGELLATIYTPYETVAERRHWVPAGRPCVHGSRPAAAGGRGPGPSRPPGRCGRTTGSAGRRRSQSRWANRIRNWVSQETLRDSASSLKLYRRQCLEGLALYTGMHRFMPTLVKMRGFTCFETPVKHSPRHAGTPKYGFGNRAFRALVDLLAVRWMKMRCLRYRASEVRPAGS